MISGRLGDASDLLINGRYNAPSIGRFYAPRDIFNTTLFRYFVLK